MSRLRDLSGQRFGRLVVIERDPTVPRRAYWLCQCDCGARKSIYTGSLTRGLTTSCGCVQRAFAVENGKRNRKHGLWDHRLYNLFMQMKRRCNNRRCHAYADYGGRGIRVEFEGAEHFIEWAMANGYKPGLTIDRENNDGNYSPSNCRWITRKEQNRNKRSNRLLTLNGETRCLTEWSERLGLKKGTIRNRLLCGQSDAMALRPVEARQ